MLGVFSFVASAYAAIKARKIDKTLNKYKVQQQFNKEQKAVLQKLGGFIEIIKNQELSKESIPDIILVVSAIKHSYPEILPILIKIRIFFLLKYLKKPYDKIKHERISYHIGYLEGALSKKEV